MHRTLLPAVIWICLLSVASAYQAPGAPDEDPQTTLMQQALRDLKSDDRNMRRSAQVILGTPEMIPYLVKAAQGPDAQLAGPAAEFLANSAGSRDETVAKPADAAIQQLENVSNVEVANIARVAYDRFHNPAVPELIALGMRSVGSRRCEQRGGQSTMGRL